MSRRAVGRHRNRVYCRFSCPRLFGSMAEVVLDDDEEEEEEGGGCGGMAKVREAGL